MPGLKYGRFRVVPTAKKGKVIYQVKTRNVLIAEYGTRGNAAIHAMNLNQLEKKVKETATATKRAGIKAAKFGVKATKTGIKLGNQLLDILEGKPKKKQKKKPKRRKR